MLANGSRKVGLMRDSSFSIQRVGRRMVTAVKACSAHRFVRHTHDEYGIGLMLAGAQRSWSGRGPVEASAGDVITVNPGEVHDGSPIGDSRTWAMLYLSPGRMAAAVIDMREGGSADMEFTDPVLREARAAYLCALTYAAFTGGDDNAADERLIMLIGDLLRSPSLSRPVMGPPMDHAKTRIDDDPAGLHPLKDLAREAGASRFQTLRGFIRLTGLPPHAYVVQRRLDAARGMIREGVALAEAATATGFADQSHFHRAFTRRYGLTPGAYAAALR